MAARLLHGQRIPRGPRPPSYPSRHDAAPETARRSISVVRGDRTVRGGDGRGRVRLLVGVLVQAPDPEHLAVGLPVRPSIAGWPDASLFAIESTSSSSPVATDMTTSSAVSSDMLSRDRRSSASAYRGRHSRCRATYGRQRAAAARRRCSRKFRSAALVVTARAASYAWTASAWRPSRRSRSARVAWKR